MGRRVLLRREDRFLSRVSGRLLIRDHEPKNLVFYLSLFSMVLSTGTGQRLKIGLGIWMTGVVLLWDSVILLVLSRKTIKRAFSGIVYYIDKTAGAIIGVLGLKLVFSAIENGSI